MIQITDGGNMSPISSRVRDQRGIALLGAMMLVLIVSLLGTMLSIWRDKITPAPEPAGQAQ